MPSTVSLAATRAKIYSADVWREGFEMSMFSKFASEKGDNAIKVKNDLTKSKGDSIVIPLAMKFTGAGVSDATLEGNEEAQNYYSQEVTVLHAVGVGEIRAKTTTKRLLIRCAKKRNISSPDVMQTISTTLG